ncbi:MAG: hypothetical protein QME51_06680, partial [Planctomycetota bacterium]|nr:hypothetical protein [Planctomycetota bacterium]
HQNLLEYINSLQYDKMLPTAMGAIGLDHLSLNNIKDAFTYLNDAIKTFPKTDNPTEKAMFLCGLGKYYFNIHQPEEAINYYKQAISLVEKYQDKSSVASFNLQLARLYYELSKLDDCQKILTEASSFPYLSQFPKLHYQALHLQGKIFEKQVKIKEALEQYQKAKEIIETVGNKITDEHLRECYFAVKERKEVYGDCERLETGNN